eukprot:TRINITY_DN36899_c0_g1_i7.p1 TRINITY_DN36899_c0_g1~~TRINITY_DN36899_c0_g1_i7.p1  ORF type:complete len:129 (+),score=27.55 TRINITY_DN36899_c0_g1_i7:775-1161(+)
MKEGPFATLKDLDTPVERQADPQSTSQARQATPWGTLQDLPRHARGGVGGSRPPRGVRLRGMERRTSHGPEPYSDQFNVPVPPSAMASGPPLVSAAELNAGVSSGRSSRRPSSLGGVPRSNGGRETDL